MASTTSRNGASHGDPTNLDVPQVFIHPDVSLEVPSADNDNSSKNIVSIRDGHTRKEKGRLTPRINAHRMERTSSNVKSVSLRVDLPMKYYTSNHANNLPPMNDTPILDRSRKNEDKPSPRTAICKTNAHRKEECSLAPGIDPPPREHSPDSRIPDDDGLYIKFNSSRMNFTTLQENLAGLYDRPPESRPRLLRGPFCCRRLKLNGDRRSEQRRRLRRGGPRDLLFTIDWFVQFMADGQNIILNGEDRLAAIQESNFVFQTTLPLKPERPTQYFILSKVAKRMYLELNKDEIEKVLKFTHRKMEGNGITYACDHHRTHVRVKLGMIWAEAERIIKASELAARCYREGVDLEPIDRRVKPEYVEHPVGDRRAQYKHVEYSVEDFLAQDH